FGPGAALQEWHHPRARANGRPCRPRVVSGCSSHLCKGGRSMLRAKRRPPVPGSARPGLEALETRCLLSADVMPSLTVLQTNLVSDLPGVALVQDPHLVNPWGISESGRSPFWISDNNAGVSTLYNVPGANNTPVSINPLVVSIPAPDDPLGASG